MQYAHAIQFVRAHAALFISTVPFAQCLIFQQEDKTTAAALAMAVPEQNLLHHRPTVKVRQLVDLASQRHAEVADFLWGRFDCIRIPVQNLCLCGGCAGFLVAAGNERSSGGVGCIGSMSHNVWCVVDRSTAKPAITADTAVDALARGRRGGGARAEAVTVVLLY